ncbi:MAG: MBL fold metallo-hydrolase [Phycisphaeraceae bacterium]|nr:MBL fold metallo-hydrolase [Phycisphaeraceae bacterium]
MQHSAHAEPATVQETIKGLTYPWGCNRAPDPGAVQQVAKGVWWLHMPLPFSLDRINLWLLEDDDGWTVVDTGIGDARSRAVWEQLFDGVLGGRPIRRVIATHMHPDHVGLAGWLTEHFACQLWMTRTEFLMCRNLVADTGKPAPQVAVDFYRAAGFDEEMLSRYRERFGAFGRFVENLPGQYQRLQDGDNLSIGGEHWQVVVGTGHSPEHACLYCPAHKLLISGDQVIPRISSNVSLFPTEPDGDPLSDWLTSCQRLRRLVPGDVLVLPAHQEPFYGLHTRLTQLLRSHERALERLFDHLVEPRRALDCFSVLFRRRIDGGDVMLATGETLAHLNCLIARGMISRRRDADGVAWYQQLADAVFEPEPALSTV